MLSAEFEPTIPATKRPQTYALDRAATGIDLYTFCRHWNSKGVLHYTSLSSLLHQSDQEAIVVT
jgi:hypothetical protein